jgi:hypothetical protein
MERVEAVHQIFDRFSCTPIFREVNFGTRHDCSCYNLPNVGVADFEARIHLLRQKAEIIDIG